MHKDYAIVSKLIAEGKTEEAIDALLASNLNKTVKKEATLIASAYATLKKHSIKGIVTLEQETAQRNQISDRLLALMEESEKTGAGPLPQVRKRPFWQYVLGFSVIVGILGGIAEFSGWNLREILFGGGANDTFSVTVFVHGKKGKDDRLLKNQGQVMLGLRSNEMPCSINEKGEATFKEIPMGFKGESVPIRIEHPQPYRLTQPDSLYRLMPNAAIYVEVALEGTHRIFGKVMDFETEQWLDSVRVSIENFATYTDAFGWFELNIPEEKQRKFQRVSFYKKGYVIEELDSIPVHVQQEIQVSLKKTKL